MSPQWTSFFCFQAYMKSACGVALDNERAPAHGCWCCSSSSHMAAASFTYLLPLFVVSILSKSCCPCPEPSSPCYGNFIDIRPPFSTNVDDTDCGGHFLVKCDGPSKLPRLHLPGDDWYVIKYISYNDNTLVIRDDRPLHLPEDDYLYNFTEPIDILHAGAHLKSLEDRGYLSMCKQHDDGHCLCGVIDDCVPCVNYSILYSNASEISHGVRPEYCESSDEEGTFFEWKLSFDEDGELFLLSAGLSHGYMMLRPDCFLHNATGYSICMKRERKRQTEAIATGVSVGAAFIIAALIGLLLLYRKRKRKIRSSAILSSRTGSTDPSSAKEAKEDLEFGTFPEPSISHYRTQVFTFEELRDATNGFSASNELGDGGFGTVYKGVLRDGRVVAVKQLYQQNYRRLEQFVNEVHLLSDLRHPNLVILYGCTSRHTRDLLLVYEYIPNGTVADHLYGTLADAGFMAWPIRMNIAIETADALRYLHEDGIQIIHRDVKTNNILLDNGFHVKVADFGLSRLFPLDATHVSTAPQGTPGYVDPEYHQCYQLTDKSDVYSFGVVLAELISSKPAVDITRQRSEINLANLTIKKIQNRELDQLVDPRLGYESDSRTREMIDSVAEVAFRCLQLEREMRPTMKEVLEELKRIRSGGIKAERGASEADAEVKEDTHLLKNPSLHSPTSVTERWASVATTPNASG